MSNSSESIGKSKVQFELFNLPPVLFLIMAVVVLAATFMKILPGGMIGAFAFMIVAGTIFNEVGARIPIVRSYLGGGPIIVIFGSATLVYFGILNERTVGIVTTFMTSGGFLDFYIAALITGSILGMSRKLLIRATFGYLPAIVGAVICAFGLVYIFGVVTGYGGTRALFFIGIPVMGGGMGAGAVPLSKMYADFTGAPAESFMSLMVPGVALANAMAIAMGGLMDSLGKKFPKLTGNGQLLKGVTADPSFSDKGGLKDTMALTVKTLGVGLLMAVSFYCLGSIIGKFIPAVHSYAWMIILVAVVKVLGLLPEKFEVCCNQWYQFIMTNMTAALLVGIGIAYTNLGDLIAAFSGVYLLLVVVAVIGAILGSSLVGLLVGFYPIEAAITAGLCMANMGGTGDVATLSAAKRMQLMPFSQISSRIGGAFILLIASFFLRIFNFGV